MGMSVCGFPHWRKGLKWPTLQELHIYLYGQPFAGWHDAEKDTAACRRCYFSIVRKWTVSVATETRRQKIEPKKKSPGVSLNGNVVRDNKAVE